ncbi:uncharacterized protein BXZ73DRAFT_104114 [Epithele typhae]|uniref:uncharacterized protein n=1 Tax=Epithele typhae TaxID=378194 RepID=UPI0020086C52|nr:uncharacterized protein BXZ73DRAFT_104114 [Epithele typhae]KAH9922294.1 hypothetical protein BXZ73DRAFT_104114 [Epithele typhae]
MSTCTTAQTTSTPTPSYADLCATPLQPGVAITVSITLSIAFALIFFLRYNQRFGWPATLVIRKAFRTQSTAVLPTTVRYPDRRARSNTLSRIPLFIAIPYPSSQGLSASTVDLELAGDVASPTSTVVEPSSSAVTLSDADGLNTATPISPIAVPIAAVVTH